MERTAAIFRKGLTGWVDGVRRWAAPVLAVAVALTVAAGWYTATSLRIDTDTTDMLSPSLPFRQDSIRIDRAFPQLNDLIAVVVDGATADQAEDGAAALAAALRDRPGLVRSVFYPEGDPYFRRNGLLYLSQDELAALIDRLAGAQVFLGKLWRDPSLRGLFDVLSLALDNADKVAPPAELGRVIDALARVVAAHNAGRPEMLSWRAILAGDEPDIADRRRVLVVQPVTDFSSLAPAGKAIDAIRAAALSLGLAPANGVRVRLTGSAPLAEEELGSVAAGMGLAGALSLALVIGLLFWGLKSVRLTLATIAALVMGLVWTAGFATLAIGRLNLISVAFAVLFIGLSVDFGIHFSLRVREGLVAGESPADALRRAAAGVGGALTLCAVAAAIAFYSFLPTAYTGLAELGLIAGTGMFIALAANLTVLPAFIALMPPRPRVLSAVPAAPARAPLAVRHARAVVAGALVLAVVAVALAPMARFDFDPMNLRDPGTESVSTLFDLMKAGGSGPYSIDILAPSLDAAGPLAAKLAALPEVKEARTLADYVPKDQEDKLLAIEQAALFLLPAFQGQPAPPPSAVERRAALDRFRATLARHRADGAAQTAVRRLAAALARLDPTPAALAALERRLVSTLSARLAGLRSALEAGPVTLADLPAALRAREVAADGQARIEAFPRADVRNRAALEEFVAAVRRVAPHATGAPVVIIEAGNAVIRAFMQAAAISIVAIALLIAVLLRRAGDVALVFAPLLLAALLTVAAAVMFRLSFNYANVIVLPLLFGLGVAAAIHLVMRARRTDDLGRLFVTSTVRAVVFSALTTIGSFGSIALSAHPGTASMGVLLTVAIALTLLTNLVVLPALMALSGARRPRQRP